MKTDDLRKYETSAKHSIGVGSVVFCTTVKQRGRVTNMQPDGSVHLALEDGNSGGPFKPHEFSHVES